jgi:hypothetical protein
MDKARKERLLYVLECAAYEMTNAYDQAKIRGRDQVAMNLDELTMEIDELASHIRLGLIDEVKP